MPCGGIYPREWEYGVPCIQCEKIDPVPDHMVEEWDAALHYECAVSFLKSEEGGLIFEHRHSVQLFATVDFDDEPMKLLWEQQPNGDLTCLECGTLRLNEHLVTCPFGPPSDDDGEPAAVAA